MKFAQTMSLLLLGLLFLVALTFLGLRTYFSWQTGRRAEFRQFAAGQPPSPLPDGSYIGHAGSQGNWLGKSFDAATATGINRFSNGERYRFHTYLSKSLTNSSQTVLKIDYNQAGNPWWLRPVVDEVVQTGPNQLLGKIQVNVIPHLAFTVGYFSLKK